MRQVKGPRKRPEQRERADLLEGEEGTWEWLDNSCIIILVQGSERFSDAQG